MNKAVGAREAAAKFWSREMGRVFLWLLCIGVTADLIGWLIDGEFEIDAMLAIPMFCGYGYYVGWKRVWAL